MKVRRIHPDELTEERRQELLAMSYEERLIRHKELLKKIYPDKVETLDWRGVKVIKKNPNEHF